MCVQHRTTHRTVKYRSVAHTLQGDDDDDDHHTHLNDCWRRWCDRNVPWHSEKGFASLIRAVIVVVVHDSWYQLERKNNRTRKKERELMSIKNVVVYQSY